MLATVRSGQEATVGRVTFGTARLVTPIARFSSTPTDMFLVARRKPCRLWKRSRSSSTASR
jgi:hypothetical protein